MKREETWVRPDDAPPTAPQNVPSPAPPPLDAIVGEMLRQMPDQGVLGRGAMGEVRRIEDPLLGRELALKLLPATAPPAQEERFRAEARITARLQHPGVVPVFALGRLPDGRLAYAMQIIRGQTLLEWTLHQEEPFPSERVDLTPAGLRRRMDIFLRICETMAYAHNEGIVHRDLKPQNIMLGTFGEVQVIDWGLAVERGWRGAAAGTPSWMAPEQALGRVIEPAADVWALGAILHFLLSGRPIWSGNAVARMRAGHRPDLAPLPGVPDELLQLRDRCLLDAPAARPPHAGELTAAVTAFLEGARRREQAMQRIDEADRLLTDLAAAEAAADDARARAARILADLPPHAPVADKLAGWDADEEADRQELEAERLRFARNRLLYTALELEPLPDAHARLADHFMREHRRAESRRDLRAAREAERNLRIHDRGTYARWLTGEGLLSLQTDPPGATVCLYAWEERHRRLVPAFQRALGQTPLADVPLPAGSWLLTLSLPGRPEVRLPVQIDRQDGWQHLPPDAAEAPPVPIPAVWPDGCCYVPPGWFWSGGDPEAADATPRRRHWLEGFFILRRPVTVAEWLEFLNDLDRRGDPALDRHLARLPGTDLPLFGRDGAGRLCCDTVHMGLRWQPDWPVMQVSWDDACAYARWRGARDGLAWRLPHGLEREKAARGVDGRRLPWGDHFDPARACVQQSHAGRPTPVSVHAFPEDESPCGACGLAGGVADWCLEPYRRDGEPEGRVTPIQPQDGAMQVIRGGWWGSQNRTAHAASRAAAPGDRRFDATSVRLVAPIRPASG